MEKPAISALFVGNSFTYFNSLPSQLSGIFEHAGILCDSDEVLKGGERLSGHATGGKVAGALHSRKQWDLVVLQDNSCVPGGASKKGLQASKSSLAEYFAPLLFRCNVDTVVLFSTWGHRGPCSNVKYRDKYPNFLAMEELTTKGYNDYADLLKKSLEAQTECSSSSESEKPRNQTRVLVAPVGTAFRLIYQREVSLGRDPLESTSLFSRLYVADAFHPSRLGTFLAANVFFATLTQKSPRGNLYRPPVDLRVRPLKHSHNHSPKEEETDINEKITRELAELLQSVAHHAVFGMQPPETKNNKL